MKSTVARGLASSAIVIAAFTASGCMSTITEKITGDELKTARVYDLCTEYHRTHSQAVLAELKTRPELNDKDRWAIEFLDPTIGMSVIGMHCLFGRPQLSNTQTTADGTTMQHVYCTAYALNPAIPESLKVAGADCPSFYVYTSNGVVEAMQNQPVSLKRQRPQT